MDIGSRTLLSGRKGLVVGIANEHSIAYGCARIFRALRRRARRDLAQRQGPAVRRAAGARAVGAVIAMPLDVEQTRRRWRRCSRAIRERWGRLDFAAALDRLCAAASDLHGRVVDSSREGFARAMDISCHSFMRMARLAEPLMDTGRNAAHHELPRCRRGGAELRRDGPGEGCARGLGAILATELGPRGIRSTPCRPDRSRRARHPAFRPSTSCSPMRAAAHRWPREVEIDDVGALCAFLGERRGAGHHRRRSLRGRGFHILA